MGSTNAGGVEGGVQEASQGVEGGVQEALEEWKEVFKTLTSHLMCIRLVKCVALTNPNKINKVTLI